MASYQNVGRISKDAFVVSMGVLLGLNIVAVASRFYIKRRLVEQFAADDVCILLTLAGLIIALVLLWVTYIDDMYLVQALLLNELPIADIPLDIVQRSYHFTKWNAIMLAMTWFSIMFTKFSFLFVFRRLVDRLRFWKIYWWCITGFCAVFLLYGSSQYGWICPYWNSPRASK